MRGRLVASLAVAVGLTLSPASPFATPAQVAAAVKGSTSITVLPSNLTPSVQQVSTASGYYHALSTAMVRYRCDAQVNAALLTDPAACFYGDVRSRTTVVLYGDSNAGNWAPALDLALEALHVRLALLAMPSCDAGFMAYTTKQMVDPVQCEEWHAHLEAYAASLHPVAVLLASVGWVYPTPTGWFQAIDKAFAAVTGDDRAVRRVLMGTSPDFPAAVPQCLAAYPSSVQSCTLSYASPKSQYANVLARDVRLSAYTRSTLLPVTSWLCSDKRCSTVVRNMMVYVDRDHTSVVYSRYLAGVFEAAMRRLLPT